MLHHTRMRRSYVPKLIAIVPSQRLIRRWPSLLFWEKMKNLLSAGNGRFTCTYDTYKDLLGVRLRSYWCISWRVLLGSEMGSKRLGARG